MKSCNYDEQIQYERTITSASKRLELSYNHKHYNSFHHSSTFQLSSILKHTIKASFPDELTTEAAALPTAAKSQLGEKVNVKQDEKCCYRFLQLDKW